MGSWIWATSSPYSHGHGITSLRVVYTSAWTVHLLQLHGNQNFLEPQFTMPPCLHLTTKCLLYTYLTPNLGKPILGLPFVLKQCGSIAHVVQKSFNKPRWRDSINQMVPKSWIALIIVETDVYMEQDGVWPCGRTNCKARKNNYALLNKTLNKILN